MLRACALLFVVAAAICIANVGYGRYLSSQDTNARALATELEVGSQQLAKFALLAVQGNSDAFDAMATTRTRIDAILLALRRGSLTPTVRAYENNALEPGAASALMQVVGTWTRMAADSDRIMRHREQVLAMTETAMRFNIRVPQLAAQLADVTRIMADADAAASQVNLANRQIVLVDRMALRIAQVLAGGDAAVAAADALQRDATVFGQVLQAMRDGDAQAGVTQVTAPAAANELEKIAAEWADAQKELDGLLEGATDLAEVQQAAQSISADSDVLLEDAQRLHGNLGSGIKRVFPNDAIALLAGLVAAMALLGIFGGMAGATRRSP